MKNENCKMKIISGKMRKIILIIGIGINLIAAYNTDFLILGQGGRGTGMGSAFSSIADDGFGPYWNPAGAVLVSHPTFSIANNSYFGLFKDFVFVLNHPIDEHLSGAVSVLYYTTSPIEEYPVSDTINGGNPLGYFNYSNVLIIGNCAYKRGNFSFGSNLSMQRQKMLGYMGFGVQMDFGMIYQGIVNIGASGFGILRNSIRWSEQSDYREPLERYFKAGVSKSFTLGKDKFLPSFDILYSYKFYPQFGLEYNLKDVFQVRVGYNSLLSYTFGAGISFWKMRIDYSLIFSGIGPINRINLVYIKRQNDT